MSEEDSVFRRSHRVSEGVHAVDDPDSHVIGSVMELLRAYCGDDPIAIVWLTPAGRVFVQPAPGCDVQVLRILAETNFDAMVRCAEEFIT